MMTAPLLENQPLQITTNLDSLSTAVADALGYQIVYLQHMVLKDVEQFSILPDNNDTIWEGDLPPTTSNVVSLGGWPLDREIVVFTNIAFVKNGGEEKRGHRAFPQRQTKYDVPFSYPLARLVNPNDPSSPTYGDWTGVKNAFPIIHAHHIVLKKGTGSSQIRNSHLILRTVGIDPYFSLSNLASGAPLACPRQPDNICESGQYGSVTDCCNAKQRSDGGDDSDDGESEAAYCCGTQYDCDGLLHCEL